MSSLALDFGVFLFGYIRLLVAFIAVVLAVKWKRNDFLAGLFFLLLWSFLDVVYITLSAVTDQNLLNASQFGFILLALVSFILGMRPATTLEIPAD